MGRLLDRVAPPRMGSRLPLAARVDAGSSNIGDGIALAAGPLLVASLTNNAVLVAMAALLQRLPWLIFGLYAGAVADRVDRRLLVMVADGARVLVAGGPRRRDRDRSRHDHGRARGHVPDRRRRGLRGHDLLDAAPDAGEVGGPGHRERPRLRRASSWPTRSWDHRSAPSSSLSGMALAVRRPRRSASRSASS